MGLNSSIINLLSPLTTQVAVMQPGHIWLVRPRNVGIWTLPGGKPKPNETPDKAATREVFEEAGLFVRLTGLVGIYYLPEWPELGYEALFTAIEIEQSSRQYANEMADIRLFSVNNLPDLLPWWHKSRINDVLSKVPKVFRI